MGDAALSSITDPRIKQVAIALVAFDAVASTCMDLNIEETLLSLGLAGCLHGHGRLDAHEEQLSLISHAFQPRTDAIRTYTTWIGICLDFLYPRHGSLQLAISFDTPLFTGTFSPAWFF